MAFCTPIDGPLALVGADCTSASAFREITADATLVLVTGDLNEGPYRLQASPVPLTLWFGAYATVSGEMRLGDRPVVWSGGRVRGALEVSGSAEFSDVWFDGPDASLEGADVALTLRRVVWTDARTPALTTTGSRFTVQSSTFVGWGGQEPLVDVRADVVEVLNSEFCDGATTAVDARCDGACRVERTVLRAATADLPLLELRGNPWTLVDDTLVLDEGPPDSRWGVGGDAQLELGGGLHTWPAEGSGVAGPEVLVAPLIPSPRFAVPAASLCEPAVVLPSAVRFDPARIRGAYAPLDYAGVWPLVRYEWWWEDEVDLTGDGVADGDGVPAMWDCRPGEAALLGPEVAGNAVDEDCDGLLACVGPDQDGDGFGALVERPRTAPCADGPVDPDDGDPCVVPDEFEPECGTTTMPTVDTGGAPLPDPGITGFVGSGCSTTHGGGSWLLAVLAVRRRVRAPKPR